MLALNRFVVTPERTADFTAQAQQALAALAARPGYRGGDLTRALDDPTAWCLVTWWESVGAYRRALNDYTVRVTATPLLAAGREEPVAYEVLATAEPGGEPIARASDRDEDDRDAGGDRPGAGGAS